MVDRTHRELTEADIERISSAYHSWRGDKACKTKYEDVQGYCHSATLEEIKSHNYVLTPGRYVGAEEVEDDGEDFDEKMNHLTLKLKEQVEQSAKLSKEIFKNLKVIGFNG